MDTNIMSSPQATDFAGNVEIAYSTITFIIDQSSPTAAITYPVPGGYVQSNRICAGNVDGCDRSPG